MTRRDAAIFAALTALAIAALAVVTEQTRAAAPPPDARFQRGVASHYGPPDEPAGDPVACGAGRVPPNVHGVAHMTLPCGALLVICTAGPPRRCVEARVTDRGPYVAGRTHDLHGRTFAAVADLSRGVVAIEWRVKPVARCVPRWVHTYWRPAQGSGGRYAPTC